MVAALKIVLKVEVDSGLFCGSVSESALLRPGARQLILLRLGQVELRLLGLRLGQLLLK